MFKFRLDKRLVVDSTLFGVLLTLVVVAADLLGVLSPLELWLYDQRALRCQHWTPPPTDKLVHVDIDDKAYESIGRWPWHRSVLAEVVDELHVAGAKAVALDLLLSETEAPEWRKLPEKDLPPEKRFEQVDHDARLAKAMRLAGSVVVATRLPFKSEPASDVFAAMCKVLAARPTATESDVTAALRGGGMTGDDVHAKVAADFHSARRRALFDRIRSLPDGLDRGQRLAAVLPGVDTSLDSPPLKAFDEQDKRVKAVRRFRRFALPNLSATPPLFDSNLSEAPVAAFGEAASAGGFVDYLRSLDGKVRSVPLFVQSEGLVYPQFGVALACRFLGADPAGIRLNRNSVVIPRPAGDLVVPVRTIPADRALDVDPGKDVPMVAAVSWFGGGDWVHMYDRAGRHDQSQRMSIARVWDACLLQRKMRNNDRVAMIRMRSVAQRASGSLLRRVEAHPPLAEDAEAGIRLIDTVLSEAEFQAQSIEQTKPEDRGETDIRFLEALTDLRNVRLERGKLHDDLATIRRQLRSSIEGRAVLVGWVATAAIADFLPTSLHPNCPGVVMHGVIFNQIVNGEVWRTLPRWATILVTLAVGLLTTLAVSFLSPARALFAAAVLLAGYLLVNGFLLFDYGNLILGAAGPVVAIGAVWSGGTLAKLGMERLERARITRRFRSYADPKLVDYVLKHPEVNVFEGQVRELTVVYIDLVGFTKLTEKMGSETVKLLNALWGALVPVIQRNDALVNKFLGDGIMFFYGAPEQSPHHARDAVNTVLQVRKALAEFNERSAAKNWPAQSLRFGVSTGSMVVGDAGAPDEERADYTVIGDYSNLGARLESANKIVGTTTLMTGRTVELAGEGFLFRPVGKLCVVGKQASVMTYEVLARLDDATDEQKRLAAGTKEMVDCFLAGRVKECMEAVEKLESSYGRSKLTDIYRERCEYFLHDPAATPFDCQIVLTEK
jgi:CHASE2 domain-containing sensor protein/class 3 adenylate cyclase